MNRLYLGLVLAIIVTVYVGYLGKIDLYAQIPIPTINNNATTVQQHAEHTFDNLIISENIPLYGQLTTRDYILLMDFTPFATSVEGHSHIAMKVPCNEDGSSKVTIVAGIAPQLNTLDVGNAINNGTLDEKNFDLSAEGRSCLYHAELPNGITDIALINTSNGTLNFNEGGYSVTVSAHGTAIQHIGSNQPNMD
ncbi:MAG: hypothetical protein GEU26_13155 [Nitrososphaeraceae archaeon]|nr:hypothetical protein [Nitrososphaeraceae archaeon]